MCSLSWSVPWVLVNLTGQEFHLSGFISTSEIQKRLLKHFCYLNGLVIGAVLYQFFTRGELSVPVQEPSCSLGRAAFPEAGWLCGQSVV